MDCQNIQLNFKKGTAYLVVRRAPISPLGWRPGEIVGLGSE